MATAQSFPPPLPYSLSTAMRGPVELSIREMLAGCGWSSDSDLLGSIVRLQEVIDAYKLIVQPSIGSGGLDTPRVVSPSIQSDANSMAQREIDIGEGATIEFKSTLLLDVNRWNDDPKPELKECRSEKMIKSVLKTIAAFLNTRGGTLLVGISDDGRWYGLEDDLVLADAMKCDFDGWELELRRQIDKNFDDNAANSYVTVTRIESAGKIAARIQCARRTSLAFLKAPNGNHELYVRSGNRSVPVTIREIESHFEIKRLGD